MLDVVSAMDDPGLFGPWFPGASWDSWRVCLKGAFALRMSEPERTFFRTVAEREPPTEQVKEFWVIVGRRGGKDSVASLITAHAAALFDQTDRLRPGERALCMALACDRDQAKIVLNYTRSYFADIEPLRAMVKRETANGFELDNGVDIAVATNSFRSVRGRPVLAVVMDEVAFWRDEASATPDEETYRAVKPGLATIPGSMLIGISTPYRRSGLLWRKFRDHYGKPGDVLVIRAPSIALNPTLDKTIIESAMEEDPAAAAAEWNAEWRADIEGFVTREVIDDVVVLGRHELPPASGTHYVAFTDPSGGSSDAMTVAVAHYDRATKCVVLDAARERKPPFSPDAVVREFAALLKTYRVRKVCGDRYGGEWPRERFRVCGITYDPAEKAKSDLYIELLPLLNAGRVELLDHPRLAAQLVGLERRTARSGRDSIDHPPGGHDDLINAAAGALVAAAGNPARKMVGCGVLDAALAEALRPTATHRPRRVRFHRPSRQPNVPTFF